VPFAGHQQLSLSYQKVLEDSPQLYITIWLCFHKSPVVITAATFKEKWEKHVSYNTFVKRKKKQEKKTNRHLCTSESMRCKETKFIYSDFNARDALCREVIMLLYSEWEHHLQ